MIDIEIDGEKFSVEPGSMIIEVADQHGIYIPRYCYHKKLSIAANCRMCLVEVEKMGKPMPACATPVMADMKVKTRSKMALDAQRAVMEFLLINHPLDCPICDQGGECELQDFAMGYGLDHSDYFQGKRAVFDEDLGPLIDTAMTRCIHCTRCVRFGEEVAGVRELGATGRGENMKIGTYVKHMMQSELSANVIDLCPVGALTSKPYAYSARSWELRETPMISPHDCIGSNIFVHSRMQQEMPQRIVMRVVPRENEAINETWISDRDRFSYLGLAHPDRIVTPKIKRDGQWQDCDWQSVLTEIAEQTLSIKDQHGAEQIAGLVSPNATVEECYILQKWLRILGSSNIDHRLRLQDFSDQHQAPAFPDLSMSIAELAELKTILLVGSDVRSAQPLLAHRFSQAVKNGAEVFVINPFDYRFVFNPSEKIITTDIIAELAQITAVLAQQAGDKIAALSAIKPSDQAKRIAAALQQSGASGGVFIGDYGLNHPQGSLVRALIRMIASYTQVNISAFTEGANTSGACLAGALPHRGPAAVPLEQPGDHSLDCLTSKPKRAYFLLGVELEYDSGYPASALSALEQAGLVVCMTSFVTEKMCEYADVILPIAPFTETDGTFVNIAGDWQSFEAVSLPHGDAKPAWKVLRVLAQLMQFEGFNYKNAQQICAELKQQVDQIPAYQPPKVTLPDVLPSTDDQLVRFAPWPMYRVDPLCRRSQPLQQTIANDMASVAIHPDTLESLQLTDVNRVVACQGDQRVSLPISVNSRLAPNAVLLPSGLAEAAGFGQAIAPISLERVES